LEVSKCEWTIVYLVSRKNVNSFAAVGNVKPGVEFNIFVDPEAAFIVFDEASKVQKKILLFPWEAAQTAGIPMVSKSKLIIL